jgi:hypothetical protein
MNKRSGSLLSRRQFARRAAVVSATAALAPAEALLPPASVDAPLQTPSAGPQLSPEGQLEADARYQQILGLYGSHLDDAQKANIKKMCVGLQPTLERIRKFQLQNGNAPALYLKPLVEREPRSKPLATPHKG